MEGAINILTMKTLNAPSASRARLGEPKKILIFLRSSRLSFEAMAPALLVIVPIHSTRARASMIEDVTTVISKCFVHNQFKLSYFYVWGCLRGRNHAQQGRSCSYKIAGGLERRSLLCEAPGIQGYENALTEPMFGTLLKLPNEYII